MSDHRFADHPDELVAVTGATGFVGSAVLRAALRCRVPVLALSRRHPPQVPGERWRPLELGDPRSLRGTLTGVTALVHAAAHIGQDERACHRINVDGSAALLTEAARAGVRRTVLVSTAAVYGPAPCRRLREQGRNPEPVSALSRSRLAAERLTLAQGGLVLRPAMVVGPGDRWVVPALARLLGQVPGSWAGSRALLSGIDVDDLGRLALALALPPVHSTAEAGAGLPQILHAAHPRPVRLADLVATLVECGLAAAPVPPAGHQAPVADTCRTLRASGAAEAAHLLELFARDHWYASTAAWRQAGIRPERSPLDAVRAAGPSYRGAAQ